MKTIIMVSTVIGLIIASSYPVAAQQSAKVRKIGFLSVKGGLKTPIEAFQAGMREIGYIEGRNIVVVYRSEKRGPRLTEAAKELVQQKVDLIVTSGAAAHAAKIATGTIPIVFTFSGDPIESGFVDSLARPGRNMTGIIWLTVELAGKRLEMLKEAFPKVSRVAVMATPKHPGEKLEFKETQDTARALGITLQYHQVRDGTEVNAALDKIAKENVNALLAIPDPITNRYRQKIAKFAIKHKLPSMFGRKDSVEAGGLVSYGPTHKDVYRRIPAHVDKILKGAKPGEIPVELPTRFELVINLNTAKQIGVTIPPSLLLRADMIIR